MIIWFIRQTNNNNNTINCSFIHWFLVLLLLLHELHFEAAMAPIYSLICEVSRVNSYDSAETNHYHFLDFLKSSLREKNWSIRTFCRKMKRTSDWYIRNLQNEPANLGLDINVGNFMIEMRSTFGWFNDYIYSMILWYEIRKWEWM